METRANYVLIGAFTLAVIVGVFGFVYWFQNIGGTGERAFYRVVFDGSVSGLRTGASVLFNGIRVGEVTGLSLDPKRPKQVVARISVDKGVAIRADTEIGLEFQGLTGISALSLKGGDINEAARSIKALAENLDKRTAELTVGILKLANSGTRTLSTIDKAAKNFDANPSRIIFGGPPPAPAKDTSPAAAKRR